MPQRSLLTFILALLCLGQVTMAQPVGTIQPDAYQKGVRLFDKDMFSAAIQSFQEFLNANAEGPRTIWVQNALYYKALCGLHLYHQNAEAEMEQFIARFPEHPKAQSAHFDLANFYFKEKDYRRSLEYFEKVDYDLLPPEKRNEAYFRTGYAYFTRKAFAEALTPFNRVKRTSNAYTSAANYYAGIVEMEMGKYSEALYDFQRAEESDNYKEAIPYLIVQVYYKQQNFDALLSYYDEVKDREALKNRDQINLLVGDAYFQKEQYQKAAEIFNENGASQTRDENLQYRIGYANFISGNLEEARPILEEIGLRSDTLAQYASYYLGQIYLKQDQQNYARNAFNRAGDFSFDAKLKEEARFQEAKVAFAQQDFTAAIDLLKTFVKDYPKSSHRTEAEELLSQSFLKTKNYPVAIQYIESLPRQSPAIKKAYQAVTYYYGADLFNDGKFYLSVQNFTKSVSAPVDKAMAAKAYFWMGEAYSIGKRYEDAINAYGNVFRFAEGSDITFIKSRYGIGYAYYNTKQYEKALVHFKKYTEAIEQYHLTLFYKDALLRLADCYYVNKAYAAAIQVYQKALDQQSPEKDYIYFQMGLVKSIQNEGAAAKQYFDKVIKEFPDSRYGDNALFQRATVDFENGSYQEAVTYYQKLISQYTQSTLVPYALLNQAIAYYNLKNYKASEANYKEILDNYMTHPKANSALLGLQEVLAVEGKSDEMSQYLAAYKRAHPDDKDLASIEFESAKSLYFNQQYEKAIPALKTYMEQNKEQANYYDAQYYLADSYYRNGQAEDALPVFKSVVEAGKSMFAQRALEKTGELLMQKGAYDQAVPYYQQLAAQANTKKQQFYAWSGMLKAYYFLANYDSVNAYADKIIQLGNVTVNAQSMAYLYKGKAAFSKGNYSDAEEQFINTINAAKDEYAAEAKYLMATIYYNQKQYKRSLQTLFEFNDMFSNYDRWLGKSFLLIADNYLAQGETYQAKATLKSVADKSPVAEIVSEAKAKLKKLEEETQQKKQVQDSVSQDQMILKTDSVMTQVKDSTDEK